MLKTLDEISLVIESLSQDIDQSKKTKSRHELHSQFRQALQRIAELEKVNKSLILELNQFPEYRQKQLMKMLGSYVDVLERM